MQLQLPDLAEAIGALIVALIFLLSKGLRAMTWGQAKAVFRWFKRRLGFEKRGMSADGPNIYIHNELVALATKVKSDRTWVYQLS